MSAPQPRASLGPGIGAALVLSLSGAALLAALSPWLGAGAATRFVVALLGFAYVLYLIAASGERVGRVTVLLGWLVVAGIAGAVGLPLVAYVLVHVGLLWLVRSLYYYTGLVPALIDLALTLLGLALAAWAEQRTHGAWLALWCFFLAQAFHALIPPSTKRPDAAAEAPDDAFARAQRAAEAAARRLSATN